MYGPAGAKRMIVDYIKWDLPLRTEDFRTYVPVETAFQPIQTFADYEITQIDKWPTLVVSHIRTSSIVGTGEWYDGHDSIYDGNPVFDCKYLMRIYCWVKFKSVELSVYMRDHYLLAIREALLDRPYLAQDREHALIPCMVDPNSIREEIGDPLPVRNEEFESSFYVEFTVTVSEPLERKRAGVLTTPVVTVDQLPYPS